MSRLITTLPNSLRASTHSYSQLSASHGSLQLRPIQSIVGYLGLDAIDVDEFREKAFTTEQPLLITTGTNKRRLQHSLPAATKWFVPGIGSRGGGSESIGAQLLSQQYLSPFANTILPYEFVTPAGVSIGDAGGDEQLTSILCQVLANSEGTTFHRFNAPLSLFLRVCTSPISSRLQRLYIAQAQIADLPQALQDDLPTPRIVKEAGKGDVYDANIWLGTPPTYTPLHKDPNPNLFVQLASQKRVRLFRPSVGSAIFRQVQQKIGQSASASFRGYEMMEGPERETLDESVWGPEVDRDGLETVVGPGDALFIPKGWWHSIKSVGNNLNASVNWWFR